MKKFTLKKLSMLGAVLMAVTSLEASSLIIYQSDSKTETAGASSSSSSTSSTKSTRKTKSKRAKVKKAEDLAYFLQKTCTAPMHSSKHLILLHAAYQGDEEKVAELLSNPDIDICETDILGNTALHYAAGAGQEKVLRLLLTHAKQHMIHTHVVSSQKSNKERAWDYGNMAKNLAGDNIVKAAGSYIEPNEEKVSDTVENLLEGFFSLFLESDETLKKRNDASSLATVPFIDIKNIHMATALHFAVEMGHLECVRLLLDFRANHEVCALEHTENYQFHAGRPLHIACLKGLKEIALLLLERKADCKALDGSKRSPLHAAAIGGCKELVQELLDRGVKEVLTDAEGKTAVQYAYENEHYVLAAFFLTCRGGVNNYNEEGLRPLHCAAMADDCTLANQLEKEGALLNPVDNNGFSPVHYAAQKGSIKMLNWCLDRVPYLPSSSDSILCTAAQARQKKSMRCIIERAHEIQPDPINIHSDEGLVLNGRTMSYLLWALEERHPDFIDTLIDKGNIEGTQEVTLIRDLWKELSKKSCAFGPYPILKTKEGATPLHLAVEEDHKELCTIILRSMIAHELLRESKQNFEELAQHFMKPKVLAFRKEEARIIQRNSEALAKGYTQQEIPKPEPFDWEKDLAEKVLTKENDDDEEIIEKYDDAMIWKILSASCWLAVKDEQEEISGDIIRLVETSIRKRIFPLIPETRMRKALMVHMASQVARALSVQGTRDVYQGLTAPQCVLIKIAEIQAKRTDELQKTVEAQAKAHAAAANERASWNRYWNNFGIGRDDYYDEAMKYQAEKETYQDEVRDGKRRALEFKNQEDACAKFKNDLENPQLIDTVCQDWLSFV